MEFFLESYGQHESISLPGDKIVFLGVHETELYSKVPEIVDTPKNNMAFEYIEEHGNGTVERAQN